MAMEFFRLECLAVVVVGGNSHTLQLILAGD